MLAAILAIGLLAAFFGLLLGLAAERLRVSDDAVAQRIDALLPQTQCAQCGFPGCRPYARAIAAGHADLNQCPPGGEATVRALADLLGRDPEPLSEACGSTESEAVARIDEALCIGCTLCVQACPVDAIVGAAQLMHTVIRAECTGCELCVAPCPVDCVAMEPLPSDPLDDGLWAPPPASEPPR